MDLFQLFISVIQITPKCEMASDDFFIHRSVAGLSSAGMAHVHSLGSLSGHSWAVISRELDWGRAP